MRSNVGANQSRRRSRGPGLPRVEFKDAHYVSEFSESTIVINAAASDLPERLISFDLREAHLPSIAGCPSKSIAQHPAFAEPIKRAVHLGLTRMARSSNSRSTRVAAMYSSLVHFAEWCWTRGMSSFKDVSPSDVVELQKQLASGHWYEALNWDARMRRVVEDAISSDTWGSLAAKSFRRAPEVRVNPKVFSRLAGSMIRKTVIPNYVYERFHNLLELPGVNKKGTDPGKPLTSSVLMVTFQSLNLLFEIYDEGNGLSFRPFESPKALSTKLARAPNRTPTLELHELDILLKECLHWTFDVAPVITATCKQVSERLPPPEQPTRAVRTHHRLRVSKLIPSVFNQVASRKREAIPAIHANIAHRNSDLPRDANMTTLRDVIRSVHEAGFYLVAFTTAKRASQIGDRTIGLKTDALNPIDPRFDVYEVPFRRVKKREAKLVFEQVSRLTAQTIDSMVEVNHALQMLILPEALRGEYKRAPLFSMPLWGHGGSLQHVDSRAGRAQNNVPFYSRLREAGVILPKIRPHVARRMYALIYYYRFELASLVALSDRLDHADMEVTKIYLTTSANGTAEFAPLDRAKRDELKLISDELELVAGEYFKSKLLPLLSGQTPIGGFPKLIRRYLRWFYKSEEVLLADTEAIADEMVEQLTKRGFRPSPMPHGVCFASSKSVVKLGAGCYSKVDRKLHRERACPSVCERCPHFLAGTSFLNSLQHQRAELENTNRSTAEGSVAQTHADSLIADLDRWIDLLSKQNV